MKETTYAEKTKTNKANQQNKMSEEHQKLIEKLIKLDQQEWTIFQQNLKKIYQNINNGKNVNEPNTLKKITIKKKTRQT